MRMKRVQWCENDRKQPMYVTEAGGIIKREYGTKHKHNITDGEWVYRNANGRVIDVYAYRTDLFEKYELIQED